MEEKTPKPPSPVAASAGGAARPGSTHQTALARAHVSRHLSRRFPYSLTPQEAHLDTIAPDVMTVLPSRSARTPATMLPVPPMAITPKAMMLASSEDPERDLRVSTRKIGTHVHMA